MWRDFKSADFKFMSEITAIIDSYSSSTTTQTVVVKKSVMTRRVTITAFKTHQHYTMKAKKGEFIILNLRRKKAQIKNGNKWDVEATSGLKKIKVWTSNNVQHFKFKVTSNKKQTFTLKFKKGSRVLGKYTSYLVVKH